MAKAVKILFLDHQGVMYTKKHPSPGKLDDFDKAAIAVLNSILEADSSIEIVISSDWKYWVPLQEMREFYNRQGISKLPIDYTPKTKQYNWELYAQQRATEINLWLTEAKTTQIIASWAAIDDINMTPHLANFVWVSEPTKGLCQEGIKEILCGILSHPPPSAPGTQ